MRRTGLLGRFGGRIPVRMQGFLGRFGGRIPVRVKAVRRLSVCVMSEELREGGSSVRGDLNAVTGRFVVGKAVGKYEGLQCVMMWWEG